MRDLCYSACSEEKESLLLHAQLQPILHCASGCPAMQENQEELATLESLDNGKPYAVAKAADLPLVSGPLLAHLKQQCSCALGELAFSACSVLLRAASLRAACCGACGMVV